MWYHMISLALFLLPYIQHISMYKFIKFLRCLRLHKFCFYFSYFSANVRYIYKIKSAQWILIILNLICFVALEGFHKARLQEVGSPKNLPFLIDIHYFYKIYMINLGMDKWLPVATVTLDLRASFMALRYVNICNN